MLESNKISVRERIFYIFFNSTINFCSLNLKRTVSYALNGTDSNPFPAPAFITRART